MRSGTGTGALTIRLKLGVDMKRQVLSRRSFLESVLKVLGLYLLMPQRFALAQPKRPIIPDAAAEAKAIHDAAEALHKYAKLLHQLDEKSSVSRAEVAQLDEAAMRAKNAMPSIKGNLEALIRKAKASGKWERLDELVAQEVQHLQAPPEPKTRFLNWLKREGGARAVLQKGLTQIDRASDTITEETRALKRKQTGLRFDLVPPAYARLKLTWYCILSAAIVIRNLLVGDPDVAMGYLGDMYVMECFEK